jgi:hypothetical protein
MIIDTKDNTLKTKTNVRAGQDRADVERLVQLLGQLGPTNP